MGKTVKELTSYSFVKRFNEFLTDKDYKVNQVLSYFPKLDEIKQIIEENNNDSVGVWTIGERRLIPKRRGDFQEIARWGEYEYYLYSMLNFPVEFVIFTQDEDKAEEYLDLMEHFFDIYPSILMQGETPVTPIDYLTQELTYIYYDDTKYNSYRINDLVSDLLEHEGSLYELSFIFMVELPKMMVTRYPSVDSIILNPDPNGSGTGYTIPHFGVSGSYSGSNTDPISVVFHIPPEEFNVI